MDVRLPSGKVIRGIPEGTTRSEIRQRLLAAGMSDADIDGPQPAVDPTEGMSGGKLFMAGVGKSFVDTGRGLGQIGAQVADFVAPRQQNLADLVAERDPSRAAAVQREIDEARELDAPLNNTGAGFAGNVAGGMAQIALPGAALIRGAKLANSAKLALAGRSALAPTTFRGAAAQGGAFAATQPVASGESRLGNAAAGAAGGLLGQGLVKTVGAAVRPRPAGLNEQQQRVLEAAEDLGFMALPSQRTGSSALRVAEAGLKRTMGGSGAFSDVATHNQTLINRLAAKELGRESDTVTRELLDDVSGELGKKYDALRSVKSVAIGPGFRKELATILREQTDRPEVLQDPDVVKLVAGMTKTKALTGSSFIAATKALRKQSRDAFRSGKSELGHAKKEIAEALEEHATPRGASPSAIVDFKKARHRYSKLLAIEDAFNERGDVSAAKLATALKRQNPKRYGSLSSDLEKAAAFEKMFPPIQSSGTAEGLLGAGQIGGAASALYAADPLTAALLTLGPVAAGRVYTSRAGGRLAEAPIRALQGTARAAQKLNPVTDRQKMLAEMLRRGIVPSGAALPAAVNN